MLTIRDCMQASEQAASQYKAWLVKATRRLTSLGASNLPFSPSLSPRGSGDVKVIATDSSSCALESGHCYCLAA